MSAMKRIDVATEMADIDFIKLDQFMRNVAFVACKQEPKRWKFCETTRMCIRREWINLFWEQMVMLN